MPLAHPYTIEFMPIYGYTCQECSQHFEVLLSISQMEMESPVCEFCGSPHTARKLGNVIAIIGSGPQRKVIAGGSACNSCSSAGSNACNTCGGR